MKYRNKHYYRSAMLPMILFPAIAATVGLTLYCKQPNYPNHEFSGYEPDITRFSSITDRLKAYERASMPETDDGEKAFFTLTGDSVLIFTGPDFDNIPVGLRKILYRDHQGSLKTIDVPSSQLRFPADSTDSDDE